MIEIYANGLIYCSACSDLEDIDLITTEINLQNPTGLLHGWKHAKESFIDGLPNPHECEIRKGFKHYLFEC